MERKHKNKVKNIAEVTKGPKDIKIIIIEYHYTNIGKLTRNGQSPSKAQLNRSKIKQKS